MSYCKFCKKTVPLFLVEKPNKLMSGPFACRKCIEKAKSKVGVAYAPLCKQVTSTNHPSMSAEKRAAAFARSKLKSTMILPARPK